MTGDCEVVYSDTNGANGLKFGPDGKLYACQQDAHRVVRYEDNGGVTVIADRYDGVRLSSPNDLTFDAAGRLWFSDPDYRQRGLPLGHDSVYRAEQQSDREWTLHRATLDTTRPNSLVISKDQRHLLVAESDHDGARELRSYRLAEDGSLDGYELLHTFHPHRKTDENVWTSKGISSRPLGGNRADQDHSCT